MNMLVAIVFIGIGATAITDLWGVLRKTLLDVPPPNYGLVGRWIAHMAHGQFRHQHITASPRIRGEPIIGWVVHYLIGIAYAAALIGIGGESWLRTPTVGAALAVGIVTVAAPFLLMQPCMGAGIAASNMPQPVTTRLHSLVTHTIFGLGLYVSGVALSFFDGL